MNLGKYQLVISISVILASAIVALLFDYLKRNNERLREANMELKARRAKELKRLQRSTAARTSISTAKVENTLPPTEATPAEVGAELVQVSAVAEVAESSTTLTEASSETVVVADPMLVPETIVLTESNADASLDSMVAGSVETAELVAIPTLESAAVTAKVPSIQTGSRRDWSTLLQSARPTTTPAVPSASVAFIQRTKPEVALLPSGFHSESVLRELLAQKLRITGLAVSIGANVTEGPELEDVDQLVRSLLQTQDFAAPSAAGEYALILKNESGASAQRRLNSIAQELWDFQITSLREHSVGLSWGGLEVRDQLLDEALAGAEERMLETRRNRKVLPMELRRAV